MVEIIGDPPASIEVDTPSLEQENTLLRYMLLHAHARFIDQKLGGVLVWYQDGRHPQPQLCDDLDAAMEYVVQLELDMMKGVEDDTVERLVR